MRVPECWEQYGVFFAAEEVHSCIRQILIFGFFLLLRFAFLGSSDLFFDLGCVRKIESLGDCFL